MNRYRCPVCGYQNHTKEKCSSCGNEPGKDFDEKTKDIRFYRLRNIWIEAGCKWHGENSLKPVDWTPYAQMKKGHLTYPISSTLNTFYDMHLINDNDLKEWADSYQKKISSYQKELPFFSDVKLCGNIKSIDKFGKTESNQSSKYIWPISKRKLNFSEEFALRTHTLDTTDLHETAKYMRWVSKACRGLNRKLPEVEFGYKLNQYIKDKTDIDPYDYLISEIDQIKSSTMGQNNELWDEIK